MLGEILINEETKRDDLHKGMNKFSNSKCIKLQRVLLTCYMSFYAIPIWQE